MAKGIKLSEGKEPVSIRNFFTFLVQDICHAYLKKTDPELVKKLKEEVKAKHVRNTHYERKEGYEIDFDKEEES